MKYLINKNYELFSVSSQRDNLIAELTNSPLNDGNQVKIKERSMGNLMNL